VRHKSLVRVLCRVLGVYFVITGASSLVGGVASIVGSSIQLTAISPNYPAGRWWSALGLISSLLYLVAGVYLFRGGRWVVDRIVPADRPYCPECGYDLSGAPEQGVCPECGVHPLAGRPGPTHSK
jgi:hypothetical protein